MTASSRIEVARLAAFSSDPAGGNPAGVVLGAEGLSEAGMLAIAAEVGYSETAFLVELGPGRFGIRYFSPVAEVAFCGHATIASAVRLAERSGTGVRTFVTPAGEIVVDTFRSARGIAASFASVATHSVAASADVVAETLAALGWAESDLHSDWPAHVAFAGNDHLILAAATRERLAALDYGFDSLLAIMTREGWTTVHVFWPEDDVTFHARDPFPVGGVVEDPATGAAAAAFGGYLNALHGRADREFTIHQGADMGRPSTLDVRTFADHDRVRVSGAAVVIR
ncbi:MAG: PhzF family phenazine biosynthesis isomerase [Micropruina sp.]|nr:PhzF family phenazine biosynthesis isomerase [Micropruina sp.]